MEPKHRLLTSPFWEFRHRKDSIPGDESDLSFRDIHYLNLAASRSPRSQNS
jgi:hypothetical protein